MRWWHPHTRPSPRWKDLWDWPEMAENIIPHWRERKKRASRSPYGSGGTLEGGVIVKAKEL